MEIKKLPKSQLEIKLIIPWDKWKNYINQAVEKLGKDLKIPGFRPGKAPRKLVEEKIGQYNILEEAAEMAIVKDYPRIIIENRLEVIGKPEAEVLKLAEEKYCPVWNMLNKELKIETKFNLIAEDCLTGPSS